MFLAKTKEETESSIHKNRVIMNCGWVNNFIYVEWTVSVTSKIKNCKLGDFINHKNTCS